MQDLLAQSSFDKLKEGTIVSGVITEIRANEVVVDIGRAHEALKAALAPLNYRNLDEIDAFKGRQTTTEFLARHIFEAMAGAARGGALGPGGEGISRIRVTLHESHVARAWFEDAVAS